MVHQMIMGAGKTTCIGPLLALMLGDGKSLVTQVVRGVRTCLYISHDHENITAIINLYYKEITRTSTLECTLECYEKL